MVKGMITDIHHYRICSADQNRVYERYNKKTTSSVEWPVTRLGGQYNSIWKEDTINTTLQNGTLGKPTGKLTLTNHI